MRASAAMIALLLTGLVGCGGGSSPQSAKGKVTLGSTPLANVTVHFIPAESDAKAGGATGVTNDAGEYTLKTDTGREGIVPGKYKVVVFDNAMDDDDANLGKANRKLKVNRVPRAYSDVSTTPITITIEAGKTDYPITIQ